MEQVYDSRATDMYKLLEIKPRLSTALLIVLTVSVASWINQNYILGGLFTILMIGVLFLSHGFIIDKDNNRIKKITYFFGIEFGKWYSLPEIKYVSVLRVKVLRKSYSPSSRMYVQRSSDKNAYLVNLIIHDDRDRPFRLISLISKEKAIEEGLKLGEHFDLRVFDSTSTDRKWIR